MNKSTIGTAVFGVLSALAVALAGAAVAAPNLSILLQKTMRGTLYLSP